MASGAQPNLDVAVTAAINRDLMGLVSVPGVVARQYEIGLAGREGVERPKRFAAVLQTRASTPPAIGLPWRRRTGPRDIRRSWRLANAMPDCLPMLARLPWMLRARCHQETMVSNCIATSPAWATCLVAMNNQLDSAQRAMALNNKLDSRLGFCSHTHPAGAARLMFLRRRRTLGPSLWAC